MIRVDIEDLRKLNNINKLAEIFSHRLNYEYVNSPVSTRHWREGIAKSIVSNEIKLLVKHLDFHIIYCRLNKLLLGIERPIINQLLKEYPYLLVIFSDSNLKNWHFVNIKYDDEVKNRRLYRRIVIGPDERLHTATQRINMLEVTDEKTAPLELQIKHDKAFDVEEVTKDFYKKYTEIFHMLSEDIAEENPWEDTYKEAQIILDRLIFLYFIQKKGWLNNNKRYLYENFLKFWKKDPQGNSFYTDFLVKLFQDLSFQGSLYKESLGNVPFLNGGLFEVDPFHSKLPFHIVIKNNTFKQIFNDLLEHFNFTVREDTPLDIEVAIDPEMLGKIFENLILRLEKGEDLRKKTGSYYTPRVIVHFMCQQSLKEYLVSESEIDRSKIELLFTMSPADQLSEEELRKLKSLISMPQARLLKSLIKKINILDPAVGSGAFLVSMLHKMLSIIKLLDVREFGQEYILRVNYDYELKRQLIETCLYGVDIQEQAVRICELRLWLSLIVDYEKIEGEDVPSLPNLSYRIRCGDSLIEKLFGHCVQLDQLVKTDKGRQLIDEISRDKEVYFLARDIKEKNRIELSTLVKQCELMESLIKEKQKSLTGPQLSFLKETSKERKKREEFEETKKEYEYLLLLATNTRKKVEAILKGKIPFIAEDIPNLKKKLGISFIWILDFAEVFKEKGGFDIVIANPPYISFGLRDVGKAKGEWADYMRKYYPNSAEYKLSIYAIFIDKGIQLLRDKGILSYITPDSFLLGRYSSKLRTFILQSCKIREIVMFEKDFWQAGVVGRPVISIIQKESDVNLRQIHCIISTLCTTIEKLDRNTLCSYSYDQRYFESLPYNRFRLFFDRKDKEICEKLEKNSDKLSNIVTFASGLIGKRGKEEIISNKKLGNKWLPGLLSGSEIVEYSITYDGNFILFDVNKLKSGFKDARYFEPKIFLRQTGDSLIAAYDNKNLLCLNNLHVGNLVDKKYDLRYILAILNSKVLNHYYHLISLELGRTMAQTDIETIEQLPIKQVSPNAQKEIINTVDKILAIRNKSKYSLSPSENTKVKDLEKQIDQKVYEFYELTDEEIALVEGSIRRR